MRDWKIRLPHLCRRERFPRQRRVKGPYPHSCSYVSVLCCARQITASLQKTEGKLDALWRSLESLLLWAELRDCFVGQRIHDIILTLQVCRTGHDNSFYSGIKLLAIAATFMRQDTPCNVLVCCSLHPVVPGCLQVPSWCERVSVCICNVVPMLKYI